MKITAICCRYTCGHQLYFEMPWKVIFVNDFMDTLVHYSMARPTLKLLSLKLKPVQSINV